MGLLTQLRSSVAFKASYAPWDNFWFEPAPWQGEAAPLTPEMALKHSAVWACIGIRSEAMASLPLLLYRRLERGKERATAHPLYMRLRMAPNGYQTAFEFEELSETHLCLRGNFYARIREDGRGVIQSLSPLNPDRVTPGLLPSGRMQYVYKRPLGGEDTLSQDQVHHRRGRSLDGIKGLAPLEYAARTLGLATAGEDFASQSFRGGGAPPFAIRHPLTLGPDGVANLKKSLAEYKAGDKYLILEEGMDAKALGLSARDFQLLEARIFDITQIARTWDVPLHMLKVNTPGSVSYASVEMFDLDFVMHRVRNSAVRNEQAIWRDLLSESEQAEYVAEYLLEAMLRGDSAARAAFYKSGIENQWLTPNEARERENMNPLPGGDEVVKDAPKTPARPSATDDPRDPRGRPRSEAEFRGRLITLEASARIVQKEMAEASKAAKKFASQPDGWQGWCREFYDDHAKFLMYVLKLPSNVARTYAESQRSALASKGLPACADWEDRVVPHLAALALGESEPCEQ